MNARSQVDRPVSFSYTAPLPDGSGTPFEAPPPPRSEPVRDVTVAGASRAPGPAPAEDLAADFKRVRRVRRTEEKVSVFQHRELWLAPFMAELVLLLGAIWLSVCLHRVIWTPGSVFPVLSFALIATVYLGLAIHSRSRELFMPRSVVLVGVGSLMVLAAGAGLTITLDAFLLGGRNRVLMALLVLIPIALFLTRCLLVFREARFTPSVNELFLRADVRTRRMRELRSKLRFWMS